MPDPDHVIDQWAKGFLVKPDNGNALPETLHAQRDDGVDQNEFEYQTRDAYGTQSRSRRCGTGAAPAATSPI